MKRQNTKNALPTKVTWIWELFTESLETQENRILGKARSREISGEGEGTIKGLSWWGFHCQRISRNCVDIDFGCVRFVFLFFSFHWFVLLSSIFMFFNKYLPHKHLWYFQEMKKDKVASYGANQASLRSWGSQSRDGNTRQSGSFSRVWHRTNEPIPLPLSGIFEEDTRISSSASL